MKKTSIGLISIKIKMILVSITLLSCILESSPILAQNIPQDSTSISNVYHALLQDDVEYGWILESIVPIIFSERHSLAFLIKNNEIELLNEISESKNVVSKLYALEGLIYLRLKSGEFLGDELSLKIMELKKDTTQIKVGPDLFIPSGVNSMTANQILLSQSYTELVDNMDFILSEPFLAKPQPVFKPSLIEDYK